MDVISSWQDFWTTVLAVCFAAWIIPIPGKIFTWYQWKKDNANRGHFGLTED